MSDDLDLFTVEPTERLSVASQRAISRRWGRVTLREPGQLDLDAAGTRVSFIAYPFELRHPLVANGRVRLADPAEIALMKAYAVGRRITGRDYIDLYYLLHDHHSSLGQIRRDGIAKFRLRQEVVFSNMGFLRALVDSADVEDWPEALSLVRDKSLTREIIDKYFVQLVRAANGIE